MERPNFVHCVRTAAALLGAAVIVAPPASAAQSTVSVGGSVPATLGLSLGAPPSFGSFTPGIAKDYTASTTANVISTAGDAALTVEDATGVAPAGHLVNGAFSLPQALRASATSAAGTSAGFLPVSDVAATLETWSAPVSNEAVTLNFKQSIGATDALRTGSYSKTVTFTLSSTTP